MGAIAEHYQNDPAALPWLKDCFQSDTSERVRSTVVNAIAQNYPKDPTTLTWLKDCFQSDTSEWARAAVVEAIAENYPVDLDEELREWLQQHEQQ